MFSFFIFHIWSGHAEKSGTRSGHLSPYFFSLKVHALVVVFVVSPLRRAANPGTEIVEHATLIVIMQVLIIMNCMGSSSLLRTSNL